VELLDYLRVLRRRWWLLGAVTLACLGASVYATERQTPIYQTSVQFYLSNGTGVPVNNLLEQPARARIATYLKLASSSAAVRTAVQAIDQPLDRLGGIGVTGSGEGDTIFMTLTVRADSARGAYLLAQGYAKTFPKFVTDFEKGNPDSGGTTLTVQEQPGLPSQPISPDPSRNYALGLALGLVLGVAVALIAESLDRSIRSVDEVEKVTGLPSLASIPVEYKGETVVAATAPRSQRAEAVRQLRTNVQFAGVDSPLRSILLTSAVAGEGKSTTAINLAITSALSGQRVLLVDADLRRPTIGDELGLETAVGLTNLVIDELTVEEAVQSWGANGELSVLTSGPIPANPSELLGSHRMETLVHELESRYELVIFDTPPVLPVTDATVLSRVVDGVVLVTKVDATRRDRLKRAVDSLRKLDVRIIGVVSNWTAPIGDYYLQPETGRGSRRRRKSRAGAGRRVQRAVAELEKTTTSLPTPAGRDGAGRVGAEPKSPVGTGAATRTGRSSTGAPDPSGPDDWTDDGEPQGAPATRQTRSRRKGSVRSGPPRPNGR
jgi:capsular exopolysaccharide synthesis family protein